MTDHTIDRLNELTKHATLREGILHRDDPEHLRAAVIRLEEYEKLHAALRASILQNGTASVSEAVLDVLSQTGWETADRPNTAIV